MPTAAVFDKEKREVDTVLASGIFNRAPNLANLLKYVCGKYFDGAAEEIKEYNIAIEALGRPAEFDQKKDSIVRVEAHRLRKRLKDFYENEGFNHEIHIEIPSGQYTPKFILIKAPEVDVAPSGQTALEAVDKVLAPVAAPETVVAPANPLAPSIPALAGTLSGRTGFGRRWLIVTAIALTIAAVFIVLKKGRTEARISPAETIPAMAAGEEVRILCGVENGSYIDVFGRTWQSDRYYEGGSSSQAPHNQIVLGTKDQQLYRHRREGTFRYDIPLKPGVYELRLQFAETMFGDNNVAGGGETTRLFEIHLNGKTMASYFDVLADAGPSTADIKVYRDVSPGRDGKIHVEFLPNTNTPFVNAIEVVPGIAGKIRPYRIVARDRGLKDNEGRSWDPDWYARGGQLIPRPDSNVQGADPELFRGERFGNITYSIPVAQPGRYGVNLYFAENWFGQSNPGGGGIGSRTFDILINGVMLRKTFDILKESGGNNRAVIVSEHGIEPNHQGKIVISLAPNQNYACINALEVIDESR